MLLITGGTGYIGKLVMAQLDRRKFPDVIFLSRNLPQPDYSQVTHVLHLAAKTHARDEREYWQTNLELTRQLLADLPLKQLKSFVYASTTCAEPGSGGYGESKLATEQLLKATLPATCALQILRIADVYGGAGEKSLEQLTAKVRSLPIMPLVGDGRWPMAPVHVDDVIAALVRSLELPTSHQLIIAGPEIITLRDLIIRIQQSVGKHQLPLPIPVWVFDKLVRLAAKLGLGQLYPDQVKRLIVKKNLDSRESWREVGVDVRGMELI